MSVTLSPATPYVFYVIGDGTSLTLEVDLLPYINADNSIPHKPAPSGINAANSSLGGASASISGYIVTLTWTTALANGSATNIQIAPTFTQ